MGQIASRAFFRSRRRILDDSRWSAFVVARSRGRSRRQRACGREQVKAVFTTPSMHNSRVTTMSAKRRRALVEVVERYDLVIIEDDVYGPML